MCNNSFLITWSNLRFNQLRHDPYYQLLPPLFLLLMTTHALHVCVVLYASLHSGYKETTDTVPLCFHTSNIPDSSRYSYGGAAILLFMLQQRWYLFQQDVQV